GQPPHEAEVDVGSDLHAELPDIEVERLILVENVAAVMRDTSEHAAEPTCAPARGASPKLLRCRDAPLASPFSPVRAYDIILSGAGVRPRPARDNGPPATVPPSAGHRGEIGRASCRESGQTWVGAAPLAPQQRPGEHQ